MKLGAALLLVGLGALHCAPRGLNARPDEAAFPMRPQYSAADSWYDITPQPGYWSWKTSSIDGLAVPVRLYPSPQRDRAPLVIIWPDVGLTLTDGRLERLAEFLREDFHVALAGTRVQPDARTARGARVDSRQATRTLEAAGRVFLDYRAALESIGDNAGAMQIELEFEGRACALAGVFHANLLLTDTLQELRCQALLTPGERFYLYGTAELAQRGDAPRPPSLLLVREGLRFRVEDTAAALPEAAIQELHSAGRGIQLLLQSEAALVTLRRFFADPPGALQNIREAAPGNR